MALVIRKWQNLSSPYFFYSNSEKLFFHKDSWTWLRELPDGTLQPLSGVTSVVHVIDKSQALIAWSVRVMAERIFARMQQHLRKDGFYEVHSHDFAAIVEEGRKTNKEILDDSADVGHIAHAWIEEFIKAILANNEMRKCELLAKLPEDERSASCCIAALQWMDAHSVEWIATERKAYSREWGVAGTCDGTARISSCSDPMCCPEPFDNVLMVIDWKSSNQLVLEYLLQTAMYVKALEEEDGVEYAGRFIIRLGKTDGEFDPWHRPGRKLYEEDIKAFRAALDLVRSIDVVEASIRETKERRKAAMKLRQLELHKVRCPKADEYQGKRKSKCFPDGTNCQACSKKYIDNHPELCDTKKVEETNETEHQLVLDQPEDTATGGQQQERTIPPA